MVPGDCPHIRTDKMFLRMVGDAACIIPVERISVQRGQNNPGKPD